MDFNLNINNKQKHWLLIIIEKCKTSIMTLLKGILKCILWIGRLLKKIWKYILGLVIIGALIGGGVAAYDYYTYTYIPQKKLDAAIEEILVGINSPNDSIKTEYALYVLDKKHEWGFEDVSNYDISLILYGYGYRESSFKLIEAKAFAGEAKYQFMLGQFYYWGDSNYHYIESDKTKAAYWWNEAASQNYTRAYNNLGIAYKDGIGVEIDLRKAVHYLKLGAEAGEDLAQRNYGDLFVDGVKIKVGSHKETRKTSNNYYGSQKVRTYYDDATMDFITVYKIDVPDYETLIVKDIEQAKYWWKKAAVQGNETAKERLQKIYQ